MPVHASEFNLLISVYLSDLVTVTRSTKTVKFLDQLDEGQVQKYTPAK